MTSDERALLAAVLAAPADDLPRLVYADYLEGDAHPRQPERAEFIRVQCELAQTPELIPVEQKCTERDWHAIRRHHPKYTFELTDPIARVGVMRFTAMNQRWDDLRRGVRGLWVDHGRSLLNLPPAVNKWLVELEDDGRERPDLGVLIARRGLVESVACSAADWIAHGDAIHWRPGQTVECKRCHGTGNLPRIYKRKCPVCDRARRVPRPCPPTAQPVMKVRLTDWPEVETRQRGGASHGWALSGDPDPDWCLPFGYGNLLGTPPGESIPQVVCEARWPGVAFEMPAGPEQVRLEVSRFHRDIRITPELIADGQAYSATLREMQENVIRALSLPPELLGVEPPSALPINDAVIQAVDAMEAQGAAPAATGEPCERCGRPDCLQEFRGWKHYGDECEMLCDDCHSTATMEE